jgi:hypothetical protein
MPFPFIDCYPMNGQMLFLWFVVGTGTDQLANLVQTPLTWLSAVCCYLLARYVGARRTDSALVGLLVLSIPTVLHQMWMAKVDMAIAAGALATMVFLSRPRLTAGALIVAGCAAGFFVGTKGSGMILAIGLLVLFLYRLLSARLEDIELGGGGRGTRLFIGLVCVFIPGFLLGSFYYLRNWVMFGNPAGIFEVKLGSHVLFNGIDLEALLWRDNFVPPVLFRALETRNQWPIVLDGFFDPQTGFWQANFIGGWGSPWTVLMLPAIPVAILIAMIRRKWLLPFIAIAGLVPYFMFSSVQHVMTRYYLPVIPVGTTAFAYILAVLDRGWVRRVLVFLAAAMMVATVFVGLQHHMIDPSVIAEARQFPYVERDRFFAFNDFNDPDFAAALVSVEEPGTTLAFTGVPPLRKNRALWNATYSNRAVYVPWEDSGEAWERALKDKNVDAVLVAPVEGENAPFLWAIRHPQTFEQVYAGELGGIFIVKGADDAGE